MGTLMCAWCGQILGLVEVEGISHGMCPACLEVMKKEIEEYHKKRQAK
jgi:phage FluMu protein Com